MNVRRAYATAGYEEAVDGTSVAVCVATYRRPEFLRALLQSLAALEPTPGLAVQVVIVDNDAAASARAVVEPFTAYLPGIVYAVEPERGIAAARNRLVALARDAGAEYVAFVDDDQWVEPNWLADLVATARIHEADAVAGPVVPAYESGVPRWIVAEGFFDRPRHPTGTRIEKAGTGNLLLRRLWLDQIPGPFDRRFDLTGGSDTHLIEQLRRRGVQMVWCDEAVSYEQIPASRATSRWLLRRAYREGITFSLSVKALDPAPTVGARRAARGLARTARGGVRLLPALFRGRATTLRALCDCAVGVGGVLGVIGVSHQEYRRVHGR